ncbi:MAG: phytanoyl-CoA dioxygenase family protein [Pseudomonadota bacterium]|nr:phytanoyl-CoA dioxygenase family protein [Pseudomonadota bacterium]
MKTVTTDLSDDIIRFGLEQYALELESEGLTIIPPEVTGVTPELIDRCTNILLEKFELMTGCPITVEDGPLEPLEWPHGGRAAFSDKENAPDPTQALLQQLLRFDRCFRDLAVNPIVDALVDQMMGPARQGGRARRLSSANSFIKWDGEFGYGPSLGLHCDQGSNPLPWGSTALNANATWTLTEYTKEGGALAYVPGSHRSNAHPVLPNDAEKACAAEAPRGSVILFPGTTWHGAFAKKTPGLRLCAVTYYRHESVLPQELMRISMADEPWDDCDNPELMRELIGFDDSFPYTEQGFPLPKRSTRQTH